MTNNDFIEKMKNISDTMKKELENINFDPKTFESMTPEQIAEIINKLPVSEETKKKMKEDYAPKTLSWYEKNKSTVQIGGGIVGGILLYKLISK